MDKESLLKNLTSEQADAMVEMMHVKLGPELLICPIFLVQGL